MLRVPAVPVRSLCFAMIVGALAALVRALLQPMLGDALPFVAALPAVALASALWGTSAGLAAAFVAALAVWMPGIPPTIALQEEAIQFGCFAVASCVIALACSRRLVWSADVEPPRRPETPLTAWLRAVLAFAVFIPLAGLVGASWWTLERAQAVSEASLAHAGDLAYRQAERTFAVAREIAQRADGASALSDAEARAAEAQIHLRLSDMTAGVNAIVNASVWNASGSVLARSDAYPVADSFSIADRKYFQVLRDGTLPVAVSQVMVGRLSGKNVMSVAIRRHSRTTGFVGIVSVTLAPSYFSDYYESLAREEPTLATFALVRNDGEVLARWPAGTRTGDLASDGELLKMIRAGAASGSLRVAGDSERGVQLASFRRVGDLPVYVVAGVSRSAMLAGWAKSVGMLAMILLPIAAGLVYVTWVALRKTRVEAAISRQLREEVHARAEAERRILESQRLETLAAVTGSVAHDFNNMLAIITSSIHVLKLRRPELADERPIGAISRSVQAGVRLTRQLLSFSKKQALRPEVIRFQSWLPGADGLMRATLGSSARWTASVDDDTLPVHVDAGELELALVNIVLNAKHAMTSDGELKVHISNDLDAPADAPMVIVCVIDNGEGIPAEILTKVFEPFFTTRQRGVGSGLGLTQVEGFCRQSGGKVTIQSVVGQGTTLCLHLPGIRDAEASTAPPSPTLSRIDARLLLVEDNEDVGKTTEQMLQSSGIDVVRVTSADAALVYLATASPFPEVVLSDIAMPGSMNGIGLASELSRRYPALPVILHTGYADQLEEATAKGMRVFQKPVPPELLLAEIHARLRVEPGRA